MVPTFEIEIHTVYRACSKVVKNIKYVCILCGHEFGSDFISSWSLCIFLPTVSVKCFFKIKRYCEIKVIIIIMMIIIFFSPTYSMASLCLHEALPGHHLAVNC